MHVITNDISGLQPMHTCTSRIYMDETSTRLCGLSGQPVIIESICIEIQSTRLQDTFHGKWCEQKPVACVWTFGFMSAFDKLVNRNVQASGPQDGSCGETSAPHPVAAVMYTSA